MKPRIIKFRAFTEKNKPQMTFLDVESVGDFMSKYGKEDTILLQYTGLKDKNGVEIYEGDIIKSKRKLYDPFGEKEPKEIEIIGIVEWILDGFRVKSVNKEYQDVFRGVFRWLDLEVIGNMYENPELL